jgi:hypothetical protein
MKTGKVVVLAAGELVSRREIPESYKADEVTFIRNENFAGVARCEHDLCRSSPETARA